MDGAEADLRHRLDGFVRYRREYLTGDEKGEAQVFLDRLFKAFGHVGLREAGATLERRVRRRGNGGVAFADLVWKPSLLLEMKKAGTDLNHHYSQAFEYWIDLVPDRPRYVVLCNFDEFFLYDFNYQLDHPVATVNLEELPHRWESLGFFAPEPVEPLLNRDLVSVTRHAAATLVSVTNSLIERGLPFTFRWSTGRREMSPGRRFYG